MVEPIYSSEESTIFYDFSVKDRILFQVTIIIASNVHIFSEVKS